MHIFLNFVIDHDRNCETVRVLAYSGGLHEKFVFISVVAHHFLRHAGDGWTAVVRLVSF